MNFQKAGCEIIEGDFETFDFSKASVDTVIMSGSLVHIPHNKLPYVFQNITRALVLRQGKELNRKIADSGMQSENRSLKGYAYISLKEGSGTRTDRQGRIFYLWQDREPRELFDMQGFNVLEFFRQESALKTGEVWLGYVLKA